MNQARARIAALVPVCVLALSCGSETVSSSPNVAGAAGKAASTQGGSAFVPSTGGTGGVSNVVSGGSASDPAAGAGGGEHAACSAQDLEGLAVFAEGWDSFGYPPYALDGCTLVYVAAAEGAGNGELRLRDLATGQEQLLQAAELRPRRPAVAGAVVAWETDGVDGSQVHVRYSGGAQLLEKSFALAAEPRVTHDAVVFTLFQAVDVTSDTDVQLFDVTTQELTPIATGAGQQRFADVSATHVAVTDFSEDPRGYFSQAGSISDIVVIDRVTLKRTVRAAKDKQAFPLLGEGGVLAYLAWGAVHPEPKLGQFRLMVGQLSAPIGDDVNIKGDEEALVNTNPAYVRPSLRGNYLDYVDEAGKGPQLFRADLATLAPPVATSIAGASRLFGPVAGDTLTLVGKPLADSSLSLVAVAR